MIWGSRNPRRRRPTPYKSNINCYGHNVYSKLKSLSAVNESCMHARVLHARVHVACVPARVICMCTCACACKHLHACVHTRIWVHMHASTRVRVSAYNVCTNAVFPFAASKWSDIYIGKSATPSIFARLCMIWACRAIPCRAFSGAPQYLPLAVECVWGSQYLSLALELKLALRSSLHYIGLFIHIFIYQTMLALMDLYFPNSSLFGRPPSIDHSPRGHTNFHLKQSHLFHGH